MKVTRLGPAQPILTSGLGLNAGARIPGGGNDLQVLTSNGSNGRYWGENVRRITSNGSNTLLSPDVNFANGANITFSVSSNSLTISSTGGGAGGISAGTSFPGTPANNDLFNRTDLLGGTIFKYDGTRWRTTATSIAQMHLKDAVVFTGLSDSTNPTARWAIPFNGSTFTIWVLRIEIVTHVATTNDGTNNWSFAWTTVPSTNAVGAGLSTSANAAGTHTYQSMTVDAVLTSTDEYLSLNVTKNSAPGNLIMSGCDVIFQLVAT